MKDRTPEPDPPNAGSGLNQWIYRTACQMHRLGWNHAEQFAFLREAGQKAGRVDEREITRAIAAAARNIGPVDVTSESSDPVIFAPPPPAWPKPDYGRVYVLGQEAECGLYDLWENSPCRFDDDLSHTEEVIDIVYPGNPLLCAGLSSRVFATRRREVWRGRLASLQFIIPNPALSVTGLTKEGKVSEHTLDATAARVYQVTEFDISKYAKNGTLTAWEPIIDAWAEQGITVADVCAYIISLIAKRLPLVLVVHSGGKSLHAWFLAYGMPESELKAFMRDAVELGADRVTWCRSQFVRMPGGTRENGNPQTIFYFDPKKAVQL